MKFSLDSASTCEGMEGAGRVVGGWMDGRTDGWMMGCGELADEAGRLGEEGRFTIITTVGRMLVGGRSGIRFQGLVWCVLHLKEGSGKHAF